MRGPRRSSLLLCVNLDCRAPGGGFGSLDRSHLLPIPLQEDHGVITFVGLLDLGLPMYTAKLRPATRFGGNGGGGGGRRGRGGNRGRGRGGRGGRGGGGGGRQ